MQVYNTYVDAWLSRLDSLFKSAVDDFQGDAREVYIEAAVSGKKARGGPVEIKLADTLNELFSGQDQLVNGMISLEVKQGAWLEVGPDPDPATTTFVKYLKETGISDMFEKVLEDTMTRFLV